MSCVVGFENTKRERKTWESISFRVHPVDILGKLTPNKCLENEAARKKQPCIFASIDSRVFRGILDMISARSIVPIQSLHLALTGS